MTMLCVEDEIQDISEEVFQSLRSMNLSELLSSPMGLRRFFPRRTHQPIEEQENIDLQKAVEYGARQMDRLFPGWYMKINLDTLNLVMGNVCIMGQLFGSYSRGLYKLGLLGDGSSFRMGLDLSRNSYQDPDTRDAAWSRLTMFWVHEVETRLDAAVA